MAIRKLRQRSQFRKPDKLHTIHYDLINDISFFKIRAESKIPELRERKTSVLTKSQQIRALKTVVYYNLRKNAKQFFLKILNNLPILKPDSGIKLIWDLLILFLSFIEFLIISFELAFAIDLNEEYPSALTFKLVLTLCFLINIFMNFNTTYYEYGIAVLSRKKVALNYLNSHFPYDSLAMVFMIGNIFHSLDYPYFTMFSLGFLLIYKTLKKIIKNLEETYEISGDIFDLLSLLFKTLCIAHVLACCWHAIGFFTQDYYISWISINHFADYSWKHRYLVSLYWAFTTMCTVGYGDITPQNSVEMGFCCFVMLCGTFGLGYCVNSVGVLLSRLEEKSKEMVESMNIMDAFMRRKNINLQLRVKVKKYLEFLLKSKNKNLEKESEILEKLPISLRHEILLESNMKFLHNFPILAENFSPEFLQFLALNIKPVQYSPTDIIYTQNSLTEQSLFLIFEGEIELLMEKVTKKELNLKILHKGEHFGEQPFFLGSAHLETARSLGFSTVFKVTRTEFSEYLLGFQNDYQRFCEIKDKGLLFNEFNNTFNGCLSCSNPGHSIERCPLLTYYPNKLFLIDRLNFSRPQKRRTFQRRSRNRNTFAFKKKVARSVMQVRFDKSLMNLYYGTVNWSQTQAHDAEGGGSDQEEEHAIQSSEPFRSHSLELRCHSEEEEDQLERVRFYSFSLPRSIQIKDLSPKKSTYHPSFCPNKDEIDRMFNKEEECDSSDENLGILRNAEKGQKIRCEKLSEGKSHVNFEEKHYEERKKVLVTSFASKEDLKSHKTRRTSELGSPGLQDLQIKMPKVNKSLSSKETINHKKKTPQHSLNEDSPSNSKIRMKISKRELTEEEGKESSHGQWTKALDKLGVWRKKIHVQIPGMYSKLANSNKTLQTTKTNIQVGGDEGTSNRLGNSRGTLTQRTSNRFFTNSSHKTNFKDNEEIFNSPEKCWGKNLFWLEFDRMKEFEFYFSNNNASQIVSRMDIEISQRMVQAKKTRQKHKSTGSGRKGIGTMKNL